MKIKQEQRGFANVIITLEDIQEVNWLKDAVEECPSLQDDRSKFYDEIFDHLENEISDDQ